MKIVWHLFVNSLTLFVVLTLLITHDDIYKIIFDIYHAANL